MKNVLKNWMLLAFALALLLCAFVAPPGAQAAEVTSQSVTVETHTRTWRIQIFTDFGADPRIEFLKERVRVINGNEVIGREQLSTVSRSYSAVVAESVTLTNGKVITPADIQEALIRYEAKFSYQDSNPTPPPAEPPAEPSQAMFFLPPGNRDAIVVDDLDDDVSERWSTAA